MCFDRQVQVFAVWNMKLKALWYLSELYEKNNNKKTKRFIDIKNKERAWITRGEADGKGVPGAFCEY